MGEQNYDYILRKFGLKTSDDYTTSDFSWSVKSPVTFTISDVMNKFTPEELINAIGINEVETILRVHKINRIKSKMK